MKRVVFDTNVWVSAIGFRGRVRALLNPACHGKFEVAVSPAILEETIRILAGPKVGFPPEALAAVEIEIRELARVVRPIESLRVVQDDPDDDRVLECAVAFGAEAIVSGDRHLLDLHHFKGIRILRVAEFLGELGMDGGSVGEVPTALQEPTAVYRTGPPAGRRAGRGKKAKA